MGKITEKHETRNETDKKERCKSNAREFLEVRSACGNAQELDAIAEETVSNTID